MIFNDRSIAKFRCRVPTLGFLALALVGSAQASILQFECEDLKGKTYFSHGGVTADENTGWADDGISESVFLTQFNLDTDQVKYQYKDASGVWWNPVDDEGAFLSVSSINTKYDGSLQFFVVSAGEDYGSVETIVISGIGTDSPRMMLTASRHGKMNGSKVLLAECKTSALDVGR